MANRYEVLRTKRGYRFLECPSPVQKLTDEAVGDASENDRTGSRAKDTEEDAA